MPQDPHESDHGRLLVEEVRSGRMTRRQLVQRASILGLLAAGDQRAPRRLRRGR